MQSPWGAPGTTVLYGGTKIFDDSLPGGRYTATYWWDDCSPLGVEAEYFGIFEADDSFRAGSLADIVSRPFINAVSGLEDSELVSYPGLLEGTTSVTARTELHSAAARLRYDFGRANSPTCLDWKDRWSRRWAASIGYRYAQLDEGVAIREDLTDPVPPTTDFNIRDAFDTENNFHGTELALACELEDGRWSVDLDARLSLGSHQQKVRIDGSTVITTLGIPDTYTGGLLAQTSNIGTYDRSRFSVIPELGASIGYRVHKNARLVVGYRLLFWPDVVRPGDQIDRTVNPNLLPPSTPPVAGPQRPEFGFREVNFVAQALSIGCEFKR
jgi:hypothetical protein